MKSSHLILIALLFLAACASKEKEQAQNTDQLLQKSKVELAEHINNGLTEVRDKLMNIHALVTSDGPAQEIIADEHGIVPQQQNVEKVKAMIQRDWQFFEQWEKQDVNTVKAPDFTLFAWRGKGLRNQYGYNVEGINTLVDWATAADSMMNSITLEYEVEENRKKFDNDVTKAKEAKYLVFNNKEYSLMPVVDTENATFTSGYIKSNVEVWDLQEMRLAYTFSIYVKNRGTLFVKDSDWNTNEALHAASKAFADMTNSMNNEINAQLRQRLK